MIPSESGGIWMHVNDREVAFCALADRIGEMPYSNFVQYRTYAEHAVKVELARWFERRPFVNSLRCGVTPELPVAA